MNLSFSAFSKKCLLLAVLVSVGVTNGIIGPTLIYLEKLTASREDEVTLVFTARSVGSLAGWLFGLLLLDSKFGCKPYNLICASTFGLFTVYFMLPWMAHLWWIMAGFTFHGLFITLILQGSLLAKEPHRQRRHSWSQCLLFANLFGCVLAPLIGVQFFDDSSLGNGMYHTETQPNVSLIQQNKTFTPPPHFEKLALGKVSYIDQSLNRSRRTASVPASPVRSAVNEGLNQSVDSNTPQLRSVVKANATNISYSSSFSSSTVSTHVNANLTLSKPSITDAKHLSQDTSAADGSKAAAIMKQLSEKRRIEEVNNVAVVPSAMTPAPSLSTMLQNIAATDNGNSTTTSEKMVVPEGLSHPGVILPDIKANATHTDHFGNSSHSSTKNSLKSAMNVSVNHSEHKVNEEKNQSIELIPSELASDKGKEKGALPVIKEEPNPALITSIKLQPVPPSGNVSLSGASKLNTTVLLSSSNRKYVLEYQTTIAPSHSFSFTLPLLPVQKIYICVSFIVLFAWLLSLFLIDWSHCGWKWCPAKNSQFYGRTAETFRLRRRDDNVSVGETQRSEFSSPSLSPSQSEPLISHHKHRGNKEYDKTTIPSYDTAQCHTRITNNCIIESDSQTSTAAKFIFGEEFNLILSTNGPVWPTIRWPSDAWMLTAEFLNSGLETAFGAFVYGFTMRYLSWSPSVSLLVTSIFWFGDLIGRVLYRFLAEAPSETAVTTSGATRRRTPLFARRLSVLSMLHIAGGLLCVVVSAVLSTTTDRCLVGSANQDTSKSHITWLFGSLLLGLGVGVTSNGPPASLTAANSSVTTANRLFMASVLGQLILPPVVGYVHRLLAVFWRYSCVLSSATLTVGILLTLAHSMNTLYLAYFR